MYILKKNLQKEGTISDENRKNTLFISVEKVDESMKRISKTIDSIRNQTRRNELNEKACFSIKKLLEGRYLIMNNFLTERACHLIINVEEDVKIFGFENELDRVISNLIKNSADAYQERSSGGEIKVSVQRKDRDCIIKIEDVAGGIKQNVADKLFVEMVSTKGSEGTGLGLFHSYQTIVGQFEGTMNFENKEGIGSIFTITLPIKESLNGEVD